MKVKSFRIKNYRSIRDSGVCYLSGDNITVLAGKNESGKTAILEALENFNIVKEIREEAIPIIDAGAKPRIEIAFEIDKETLEEIYREIGIEIKPARPVVITLIKEHPTEYRYYLEELTKIPGIIDESLTKRLQKQVSNLHKQIQGIYDKYPQIGGGSSLPKINFDDPSTFLTQLSDFKRNTKPNLQQIAEVEERDEFNQALDEIIRVTTEMDKSKSVRGDFVTEVKNRMPNFILFSSFEDVFPSEIPLAQAGQNPLIEDLDIISELNLELIMSGTASAKKRHKELLNVRVREDYQTFWTQDLTNLAIDWDSNNLNFFVREGDNFYPPNMRSKGKQWHLAFYIRVSARAREDVDNVILIDEPGLYIHAKAQEDILRKLEDCAKHAQIIYSTHSPYLIEIDNLHRVRLILRYTEEEGTLISNKIHKGADKETLTPIITAIGLDLSQGLDIAKNNNVIFEGITDYYYIRAFQELLKYKFNKDVHCIPGAGVDKTSLLASLMIGWEFNFCIVLDNDSKGRRVRKKLLRDFEHVGIKIVSVSENIDDEIEDLFSKADFVRYVLNEQPDEVPEGIKNSQILKRKDRKYDKVLLSKYFFEQVKQAKLQLSTETKQHFKKLLREINSTMFPKV